MAKLIALFVPFWKINISLKKKTNYQMLFIMKVFLPFWKIQKKWLLMDTYVFVINNSVSVHCGILAMKIKKIFFLKTSTVRNYFIASSMHTNATNNKNMHTSINNHFFRVFQNGKKTFMSWWRWRASDNLFVFVFRLNKKVWKLYLCQELLLGARK